MQETHVWLQMKEFITLHNMNFGALDSNDFSGFGQYKFQVLHIFIYFWKSKVPEWDWLRLAKKPFESAEWKVNTQ